MSEVWRKMTKQLRDTSGCKHSEVNDVLITLKAHKVNNESIDVWYSANIHSYMTSLKHFASIQWLKCRHWWGVIMTDSCRQ